MAVRETWLPAKQTCNVDKLNARVTVPHGLRRVIHAPFTPICMVAENATLANTAQHAATAWLMHE
jgi:hypothetical protein